MQLTAAGQIIFLLYSYVEIMQDIYKFTLFGFLSAVAYMTNLSVGVFLAHHVHAKPAVEVTTELFAYTFYFYQDFAIQMFICLVGDLFNCNWCQIFVVHRFNNSRF